MPGKRHVFKQIPARLIALIIQNLLLLESESCFAVRIHTTPRVMCACCEWGWGEIEPALFFMPRELKSHPAAGPTHPSHGVRF